MTKDETEVAETLVAAIDAGYRHIDTAFAYRNEALIGRALQTVISSGKVKREDLFIVTKLPCNGLRPESVEYFFKKSLKDLQLNYIDLYLIHFPVPAQRTDDDYAIFPMKDGVFLADTVDLTDTWKAMEHLADKDLAKSIGISNFNSEQIQRVYNAARIKPAVLQVECHAYLPQYELHNFCKNLNIAFTAYSPIGAPGQPEFKNRDTQEHRLLEDPKLKPICEKYGKSPAQILLRYLTQRGIIVIPKSSNPRRLKENMQIFDFSLSDEDMNDLKSLARGRRYFTMDSYKGLSDHPEYPFKIPF
ncbi:aldo-keto reductase family 1 member A1-like [Uloborus diversus]|uniref:aldo-keto reductase family 1 member A1-like n=1 Tax=Uloborus diversus TaxID=327109 RepID=UPI00240A61F6|nr:aldo-keto reductase family 1 member A1-like [Uloborus diversus]